MLNPPRRINEVVIVPLVRAYLCPQHDAIINMDRCPLCGSETIVLGRVLGQALKERNEKA